MNLLIYTQPVCDWCDKSKKAMTDRGWSYTEKVVGKDIDVKTFKECGHKTVPQIFDPRGNHIGGYEDLIEFIINTTGYADDGI